jgi:hypothetical protein
VSVEVTTEVVLPGEGAIIFGRLVTPDTPLANADELDSLPNWGKNREKPKW